MLVNNAATTHFVAFADLDGMKEEYWDDIFAVNVKGVFFCSRAAAKAMRKAGGGAIVNVASVAGVRAVGSSIAYAASKAARHQHDPRAGPRARAGHPRELRGAGLHRDAMAERTGWARRCTRWRRKPRAHGRR